jgi:hypothetical protein
MNKSKAAFLFSAERLAAGKLYLWTCTFADVLSPTQTRSRWNHLLTLMRRPWPPLCGLRVFELHDLHGLHVHLVTNRFVDVNVARRLAKNAKWGRIHVMRIPVERGQYLAKYLSKNRESCLKSWRLWAGFGKWDWSRVKEILIESPRGAIYRFCQRTLRLTGNRGFQLRIMLVEQLYLERLTGGASTGAAKLRGAAQSSKRSPHYVIHGCVRPRVLS